MKMPEKIEPVMFAPCGMNCLVCYKHCYHKKPCTGCLKSDQGKPKENWELPGAGLLIKFIRTGSRT